MCIFTDELHSCSYAQTVNSARFLEMLFCTHSFTSLLRFGSLNALLTLLVEKDCVGKTKTSRSRGETGDIILLNESLRFIQNVASCYALCLTKESVNTATLVHAPACVRVCACVRVRVRVRVCVRAHSLGHTVCTCANPGANMCLFDIHWLAFMV